MEYIDQEKNSDVYDFMGRNPCPVLSTVNAKHEIDLAHVFVYIDLKFNLYFTSKIETRKVMNVEDTKSVVLLFSDRGQLQQVEYKGEGAVLTDAEEIMRVWPKITDIIQKNRSEYWTPPLSQVPGEGYAIVKITPDSVLYRDYAREEKDSKAREYLVQLSP